MEWLLLFMKCGRWLNLLGVSLGHFEICRSNSKTEDDRHAAFEVFLDDEIVRLKPPGDVPARVRVLSSLDAHWLGQGLLLRHA